MKYIYNDGGRSAAGYKGSAGDCVTRAIAITTGKPYQEVYDALSSGIKESKLIREREGSPRNGVNKKVYRKYLESLGWKFVPTMTIGSGCKTHLKDGELPSGNLIVRLSKHLTSVINGVIYDTHDPSRDGTRCVYGYYIKI